MTHRFKLETAHIQQVMKAMKQEPLESELVAAGSSFRPRPDAMDDAMARRKKLAGTEVKASDNDLFSAAGGKPEVDDIAGYLKHAGLVSARALRIIIVLHGQ